MLDHFVEASEKELKLIATNYQEYSVSGVSSPVGKCFYPSGFSHTIVLDPDYARVRSLSALETWSLLGGESNTFPE